jgi:hypothetical protein
MARDGLLEPETGGLNAVDWRPDDRKLRQFGWAALALLPLVGWLVAGRPSMTAGTVASNAVWAALGLGAVAATLAVVRPQALRWPFVGLTLVALPIGIVVGEILFATAYFLVLTPFALAFRLLGRDALQLRWDENAETYWQPRRQRTDPTDYFRQS